MRINTSGGAECPYMRQSLFQEGSPRMHQGAVFNAAQLLSKFVTLEVYDANFLQDWTRTLEGPSSDGPLERTAALSGSVCLPLNSTLWNATSRFFCLSLQSHTPHLPFLDNYTCPLTSSTRVEHQHPGNHKLGPFHFSFTSIHSTLEFCT